MGQMCSQQDGVLMARFEEGVLDGKMPEKHLRKRIEIVSRLS